MSMQGRIRFHFSNVTGSMAMPLLALALLSGSAGCAATSEYMKPVPAGIAAPAAPTPDAATVVFVRPSGFAGSLRTTILDGHGRFLGDSLPESYFAVKMPPGEHVFISWAENTAALRANLVAGNVYYVEVSPKMGAFSARAHLLAISPRTSSWKKLDEWLSESTAYAPDEAQGQAYLTKRKDDVAERIRRADEALKKYSKEELDDRTLLPTDHR